MKIIKFYIITLLKWIRRFNLSYKKISENICWIGIDENRNILFEGLWPIPEGVSYNSYIVKGSEKIAVIDTVDKFFSKEFISNIEAAVDPSNIDYIVLNHLEPDHSGSFDEILEMAPKAKVVGSQMAMNIAKAYYLSDFESVIVKDGDTLSLGGLTLRFITTPWLHWPETIFTYVVEDQVLFTGDAFASFGAVNGRLCDDESDLVNYETEMKRYFADIISHYSSFLLKAAEKIKDLPIKMLCTTHGLVFRKNPSYPITKYLQWCCGKDENKVLIIYGSMYDHTKEFAEYLENMLKGKGVAVKSYNLGVVHPSYIMTDLIDSKIVLIGSPTYEGQIFPLVTNMIEYMKIKHVKPKYVGIFANFSWGSTIIDSLKGRLTELNMKVLEPQIMVKGRITEEDRRKANLLIESIMELLK